MCNHFLRNEPWHPHRSLPASLSKTWWDPSGNLCTNHPGSFEPSQNSCKRPRDSPDHRWTPWAYCWRSLQQLDGLSGAAAFCAEPNRIASAARRGDGGARREGARGAARWGNGLSRLRRRSLSALASSYMPKLCRPGTCTGTCTEVWPKRSHKVCARPCIKILHGASMPQTL